MGLIRASLKEAKCLKLCTWIKSCVDVHVSCLLIQSALFMLCTG